MDTLEEQGTVESNVKASDKETAGEFWHISFQPLFQTPTATEWCSTLLDGDEWKAS